MNEWQNKRSTEADLCQTTDTFKTVRHVIVNDDGAPNPVPNDPRILKYEDLMAKAKPRDFPTKDEREVGS